MRAPHGTHFFVVHLGDLAAHELDRINIHILENPPRPVDFRHCRLNHTHHGVTLHVHPIFIPYHPIFIPSRV